eukprot:TRINITY_DN87212_c0_g1_i1.p1 TRINITY_DN87212_c0_g1~~TRINITY_DN87212_c0_g1_i1.p1  ORF type:complete len:432 (+),score=78.52 TRINITY_DN87212_c0_g1_i1:40-1296(+)
MASPAVPLLSESMLGTAPRLDRPRSLGAQGIYQGAVSAPCAGIPCGVAALTAAAAMRGLRVSGLRKRKIKVVTLNARSEEEDIEELRREAARLRAEIEELKDEQEEQRQREQALLFKAFDTDDSRAIDLKELQRGLKEFWGIELEESTAQRLLDSRDLNRDGVLQPEEFDLASMEDTYRKLRDEERAKQSVIRAREAKISETEAMLEEYLSSLPETNQDTGALTRLGSVLAYTLPTIDSLRFAAPVAKDMEALKPFFNAVVLDVQVLDQVSYGLAPLMLFLVFQGLANNTDIPKLLRFNLRQSVLLTVALFIPGILGSLATFAARLLTGSTDQWGEWHPGSLPVSISDPCNAFVFIVTLACILYSSVSSLLGAAPTAIPLISAEAERTMAQTRDSALEARLRKQLLEAQQKDDSPPTA